MTEGSASVQSLHGNTRHGMEAMAARALDSWSHCIRNRKAERWVLLCSCRCLTDIPRALFPWLF